MKYIEKWRDTHRAKYDEIQFNFNSSIPKEHRKISNKLYRDKVKYYSYDLESKRFFKILLYN